MQCVQNVCVVEGEVTIVLFLFQMLSGFILYCQEDIWTSQWFLCVPTFSYTSKMLFLLEQLLYLDL